MSSNISFNLTLIRTGSGKTFTMIGNEAMPGIAPRAFQEIFGLLESKSNVKKFSFKVTLYMCELYNDMLLDLLDKNNDQKLDIKKDKKGYRSDFFWFRFQNRYLIQILFNFRHDICTKHYRKIRGFIR